MTERSVDSNASVDSIDRKLIVSAKSSTPNPAASKSLGVRGSPVVTGLQTSCHKTPHGSLFPVYYVCLSCIYY